METAGRDWLKAGVYNASLPGNADNDKLNANYLAKGATLVPGMELLAHVQPKTVGSEAQTEFVIDFNGKGDFYHYAGKNFTKGEVYGYTIRSYPDNEYLLASFGYTVQNNPFDYVQFSIRNALRILGPKLQAMYREVKCIESEAPYEDAVKQKYLYYNLRHVPQMNNRLLNYARYTSDCHETALDSSSSTTPTTLDLPKN